MSATTPGRQPAVGAVFNALSDPTRRRVIELLSERQSVTASGLAQELPMTRQAIAKHMTTLMQAGLVTASQRGREIHYRLTPEPLTGAMSWMAAAGARWDERLARLSRRLEERR